MIIYFVEMEFEGGDINWADDQHWERGPKCWGGCLSGVQLRWKIENEKLPRNSSNCEPATIVCSGWSGSWDTWLSFGRPGYDGPLRPGGKGAQNLSNETLSNNIFTGELSHRWQCQHQCWRFTFAQVYKISRTAVLATWTFMKESRLCPSWHHFWVKYRYGSLHGSVLGVEAVLASGEVVDCLSRFPQQCLYYNTYNFLHFFYFSRLPAWRRTTLVTTWSTFSSVLRALWALSPGSPYLAQLDQGE